MEGLDDAQDYLLAFDPPTRRRGEAYFRQGRVGRLQCTEGGRAFTATVQGSSPYEVELSYDEAEGWTGTCSCPMELDCKHAYAMMKALLAEHSIAAVRGLSAGLAERAGKIVPLSVKPKAVPVILRPLPTAVEAALGRNLKTD